MSVMGLSLHEHNPVRVACACRLGHRVLGVHCGLATTVMA